MRTKTFFWNSVTSILSQIFIFASGLIVPRVMLVAYGSDVNGLVSSISQFITYFNLLEAGLSGATVYALYKPLADQDTDAINGILSASRKFYLQIGWLFTALVGGLALLYPLFIQEQGFSNWEISLLVLVLGGNGALEFFTLAKYRTLLTADQKTYVICLADIVRWTVYTAVIVVFTALGCNIILTRAIALLAIFARSIFLVVYCKRRYRYLDYSVSPNVKALDRRWSALYLQLLGLIRTSGPVVLLTVVSRDLALISIYTVYNIVVSGVQSIIGIFYSGLTASFGDVIAKGERDILKRTYSEFETLFYTALGVVYTLCFALILPFIQIYTAGVTDAEYIQPLLAVLFVLNGMLYNVRNPQGMLVISAGMYKETQLQSTLEGGILLVAGGVLCYFYGLTGLLIGILLSNLYRDIDLTVFVPRHITHIPIRDTLKQYGIVAAGLGISLWLIHQTISLDGIDSYLTWCVAAIKMGVLTVAVFALLNALFNRRDWPGILRRVKLLLPQKS